MTETETLVYVDLFGKPYLVGSLWTRTRKEKTLRSIAKSGSDFIISCELAATARGATGWTHPVEIVISEDSFRMLSR